MRYTTIIDIAEYPVLYRNVNARLLYLHLVLKAGYHDDDRDIVQISLRQLSYEVGLSLSAVRHALKILATMSFIRQEHGLIIVKKWVEQRPITKRSATKKEEQARQAAQEREQQQADHDKQRAAEERKRAELEARGLSPFIVFYEAKVQEYQRGDIEVLTSLKRNREMYLNECKRKSHEPLVFELNQ